jgi:hypothetical protein
VLEEVASLTTVGVREVTLIGQNVNSYRGGISFADLLLRVAQVPGIERVRFTTSHPHDLSDALIEAFRQEPRIAPHFHLPVQSGSDTVLRRMKRDYTVAEYLQRLGALRAARPASPSPPTSSSASPERPRRTSSGRSPSPSRSATRTSSPSSSLLARAPWPRSRRRSGGPFRTR